jgi:hypothetical protein
MTATLPKIPDPLVVLRRAEQKHTGEEAGDLDHLADAVRVQIITPLTAGGRPVVDDVQVKQLLADKQRLEDVVADLRKQVVGHGKTVERQTRELHELKNDLDEARAARDTAVAQLRDRPAAGVDASVLDQAQRDNARLADELAQTRRNLELANRTLDEIADEDASRPAVAHRHEYEVDPRTGEHWPCPCGKPWIRDLIHDDEPVVPDVEPWDALFDRIRAELGEAS